MPVGGGVTGAGGDEGLPTCPVAGLGSSVSQHLFVCTLWCLLLVGSSWEACGSGTVSLWGHCGRQAAFKDWKQQVPVIESRGMVFTHYRKPGMLLGDFYLLRKANFWQSPKDCWLDPTLGGLGAPVWGCKHMWARCTCVCLGPGTGLRATHRGCSRKQKKHNQCSRCSSYVSQRPGLAGLVLEP